MSLLSKSQKIILLLIAISLASIGYVALPEDPRALLDQSNRQFDKDGLAQAILEDNEEAISLYVEAGAPVETWLDLYRYLPDWQEFKTKQNREATLLIERYGLFGLEYKQKYLVSSFHVPALAFANHLKKQKAIRALLDSGADPRLASSKLEEAMKHREQKEKNLLIDSRALEARYQKRKEFSKLQAERLKEVENARELEEKGVLLQRLENLLGEIEAVASNYRRREVVVEGISQLGQDTRVEERENPLLDEILAHTAAVRADVKSKPLFEVYAIYAEQERYLRELRQRTAR